MSRTTPLLHHQKQQRISCRFTFIIKKSFSLLNNDSDVDVTEQLTTTSAACLILTGDVDDIQSLALAAEGMVVCRF